MNEVREGSLRVEPSGEHRNLSLYKSKENLPVLPLFLTLVRQLLKQSVVVPCDDLGLPLQVKKTDSKIIFFRF